MATRVRDSPRIHLTREFLITAILTAVAAYLFGWVTTEQVNLPEPTTIATGLALGIALTLALGPTIRAYREHRNIVLFLAGLALIGAWILTLLFEGLLDVFAVAAVVWLWGAFLREGYLTLSGES